MLARAATIAPRSTKNLSRISINSSKSTSLYVLPSRSLATMSSIAYPKLRSTSLHPITISYIPRVHFPRRFSTTTSNAVPDASQQTPPPPPPASTTKTKDEKSGSGDERVESESWASWAVGVLKRRWGILFSAIFINLLILANTILLQEAEDMISDRLHYVLPDDDKLFAWQFLKLMALNSTKAVETRLQKLRELLYHGLGDNPPLVKHDALFVLGQFTSEKDLARSIVMHDIDEAIEMDRVWSMMQPELLQPSSASISSSKSEPELFTTARLRARFTDLFANLSQADENRSILLQDKYLDRFFQLLEVTKGSSVIGDKLSREHIATILYNLALSPKLTENLVKDKVLNALNALRAREVHNNELTNQLAVKALLALAETPAGKNASNFPKLTTEELTAAKAELITSAEDRGGFSISNLFGADKSTGEFVKSFGISTGMVVATAMLYGTLRTMKFGGGNLSKGTAWKEAFTKGGLGATKGALLILALSMGLEHFVTTPLEKKHHIDTTHIELTSVFIAIPFVLERYKFSLAPLMAPMLYEVYQQYTADFIPQSMEAYNELSDTFQYLLLLQERLLKQQNQRLAQRAAEKAEQAKLPPPPSSSEAPKKH